MPACEDEPAGVPINACALCTLGQRKLGDATALVLGCGALGSLIVDLLARAGVGRLSITVQSWSGDAHGVRVTRVTVSERSE